MEMRDHFYCEINMKYARSLHLPLLLFTEGNEPLLGGGQKFGGGNLVGGDFTWWGGMSTFSTSWGELLLIPPVGKTLNMVTFLSFLLN